MTQVTTMPIEIFIVGSVLAFLAKTAIYTLAACFVIRYALSRPS
jgi:hypothetical protein